MFPEFLFALLSVLPEEEAVVYRQQLKPEQQPKPVLMHFAAPVNFSAWQSDRRSVYLFLLADDP